MKTRLIFILVLLSFLSVPFVHSETPKAVTGLVATMDLDKGDDGEYDSDPITLTYTLKNESTKSIFVLRWGTPLEGFMSNFLDIKSTDDSIATDPRSSKQTTAAYNGYLVSRIGPLPEDYVEIPAGKTLEVKLPVHEGYQIQKKGKYTITLPRKMILDAVHEKPAAGEVIKRKLVPATVEVTKKELKFKQKEERPWVPVRPGPKSPAPVSVPPAQQPGTPGSPAPGLNAPGQFRIINKAPQPWFHLGLSSGSIQYASYSVQSPSFQDPPKEESSYHKEITGPDKEKVKEAYEEAFKMAAQTKVILNAGEGAVAQTNRFTSWFGKPGQIQGESSEKVCETWKKETSIQSLTSNERYNRVRSRFGNIYSRFFDTAEQKKIRFFYGTRKTEGKSKLDGEHEDALKDAYPCDYNSAVAYVWASEEKPVLFLCDSFFTLPADRDQAGVIIHELSHKAGVLSDKAYQEKQCLDLASCVPDEALDNADNYHLFASNPKGFGIGLEQGQWYAHFGTLESSYLSSDTGRMLSAQRNDSTDCSSCVFVLARTPPNDSLNHGDTVSLLSYDGVNAVSASGSMVSRTGIAEASSIYFRIYKTSGNGKITTSDEIYLESITGGTRLNVTTGAGNKNDLFIIELAR